jgi:hypothetical protein
MARTATVCLYALFYFSCFGMSLTHRLPLEPASSFYSSGVVRNYDAMGSRDTNCDNSNLVSGLQWPARCCGLAASDLASESLLETTRFKPPSVQTA